MPLGFFCSGLAPLMHLRDPYTRPSQPIDRPIGRPYLLLRDSYPFLRLFKGIPILV